MKNNNDFQYRSIENKTYTVEYKCIAYFTTDIVAFSEEEATELAKLLPKENFKLEDTLDGSWEHNQTYLTFKK